MADIRISARLDLWISGLLEGATCRGGVRHLVTFICLGLIALESAPALANTNIPPLNVHGNDHLAACNPSEWIRVKRDLTTQAKGRAPDQLADLVENYLCKQGRCADAKLRMNMPLKIWQTDDSLGEISVDVLMRNDMSALGGAAWEAKVEDSGKDVEVSFYPNEACIHAAQFRFKGGAWMVIGMSSGCD
ncbi:MAG: hypothetical protein Q7T87_05570 [Polaromonas sp.]|nr:hypothetical protein [Polaromonas sp.]